MMIGLSNFAFWEIPVALPWSFCFVKIIKLKWQNVPVPCCLLRLTYLEFKCLAYN